VPGFSGLVSPGCLPDLIFLDQALPDKDDAVLFDKIQMHHHGLAGGLRFPGFDGFKHAPVITPGSTVAKAANLLGIHRTLLYKKMKEYHIPFKPE
jgi:hypothetical protein